MSDLVDMTDLGVWLAQQCQEDREWLLKYQPKKFVELKEFRRYYAWMTDSSFIEAKLDFLGAKALIEDYNLGISVDDFLPHDQTNRLNTLRRIANFLVGNGKFIERRFVLKEINSFFREYSKGYFVLEGDPGVGKTVILAHYALSLKYPYVTYFNSPHDGTNSAKSFLYSVCTQLIQCYNLNYKVLPDNATRDGGFLGRLLGEVSQKLGGSKLVLVVDALDEVDLNLQSPGSNVLYLPEHLPTGVYFIVSKRRKSLPIPRNHFLFDLSQHDSESVEDVKAYIHKIADKSPKIQSWIHACNLSMEKLVTVIADTTKNNFLYCHFLLNEIESGTYSDRDLKDLPADWESYCQVHWQRMNMNDKSDKESRFRKLRVIYVLSEIVIPISCESLADILDESSFNVQCVLHELEDFVQCSNENPRKYSIYHASFQRFLKIQRLF